MVDPAVKLLPKLAMHAKDETFLDIVLDGSAKVAAHACCSRFEPKQAALSHALPAGELRI